MGVSTIQAESIKVTQSRSSKFRTPWEGEEITISILGM